jgi:hypothetical protein
VRSPTSRRALTHSFTDVRLAWTCGADLASIETGREQAQAKPVPASMNDQAGQVLALTSWQMTGSPSR